MTITDTYKHWVKERGQNCYCPLTEDGHIVLGLNIVSDLKPDGAEVVGEFWYDEKGDLQFEPYEPQGV